MVIAQGALRSHPWLFKEVEAVQNWDEDAGFQAFETAFEGHVGFAMANIFGAFFHNVTFGLFAVAPKARYSAHWYRQASRAARNFALVTDLSVAILGGGLKTKQHITGRLADALSDLYFVCCMLKRFEDDGEPEADRVILDHSVKNALHRFYASLGRVIANFPNRIVAVLLRVAVFPLGNNFGMSNDQRAKQIVSLVLEPSATPRPADPRGLRQPRPERGDRRSGSRVPQGDRVRGGQSQAGARGARRHGAPVPRQ